MKCEEVREQLDLLAAGECEAATKAAIEQHLGDCPACAAAYAESERLVGLLDLHWNDQRLERLRQRIEQQAEPLTPGSHAPAWEPGVPTLEHGSEAGKPTREGGSEAKARRHLRFVTPYVRRGVAIAALFLIAVGLMLWTPVWSPGPKHSEPAFTLLVHARKENMVPGHEKNQEEVADKAAKMVAVVPLAARDGAEFRQHLAKAKVDGKLPPPPAIRLDLDLINAGKNPVQVRLGDVSPTLSLELSGDAVVRMPATKADEAEEAKFLRPQTLRLGPGEKHVLHIDRLIAGSHGKLEYIYPTEPGEYSLTARLRLTADGKVVTVTGEPVRIKVGN